jgi:8-oxo-dGTP diphosphatase
VPVRVVAGLIYQGDRVLVCQRKEGGSFPLKWEFPGGKVENREDDLATLRRELKEELGIEVQSAGEVFRHSHSYPDQIVDLIFFKIEIYRGSVSNKVFERVRWLNVKDLKELDFLEGDLPLIEKLISGKLRV